MDHLSEIMCKNPVIHCVTNVVTVNDCANILLAAGASPIMAHASEEVEEVTSKCGGLVLNMGATENYEAMLIAGKTAKKNNIPIVLDPVGTAGSSYRRKITTELIEAVKPDCIRGNYSEIKALAKQENTAVGVDSSDTGMDDIEEVVKQVALRYKAVVVASGETDHVSDGEKSLSVKGGSSMMRWITGAGCMASALMGAFLAVSEDNFEAITECVQLINQCSEKAEKIQIEKNGGNMAFHDAYIDQIFLAFRKIVILS